MNPTRWLAPFLAVIALTFVAGFGLMMLIGIDSSKAAVPSDDSYITIGGVQYHAVEGRPIDPSNPVDAGIIAGLPANERHPGKGHVLYGAFVTRADTADATLPSASRIDLLDSAGHLHRQLRLSAGNPYTYLPGKLAAGEQLPPAIGTPAADNLAAGGQLLLYDVPAWQVRNGFFQLVVHDPLHPGTVGDVQF
jgi:hypothetical protein